MDREIKFRAWNKELKIMVYSNEDENDYWDGVCLNEVELVNKIFKDSDYEWMQYIGLRDKNNIEIYAGDILKDDKDLIYKIVWGYDLSWLAITNEEYCNCYCPKGVSKRAEVIGNIYENKLEDNEVK